MKKRILALLLAAVMLLSLSGCDSREKPEPEEIPNQEEVQTPEVKPEEPEEKQEIEEEIVIEKPELGEEIAELKAKNDDVVGWLQIPDTEIDNAVVQTTNNEFYLRKDELKQYSWTGCYWIDFECTVGPTAEDLGRSTVIYGHNVNYDDGKDKERFSQLFHFADEQWAKEHPYIYFSTPEEDMAWEVFAVAYTTDDFNYIQVLKDRKVSSEQITEAQMINIVNEARERSEYDYNDVEVNGDDKIITLSTCSYKYGRRNDVRFIVMAKLVTEEDTPVETANITINEDKKEVQ
ncbi:MAG: class B sortase [Ruminococcaceae bacterium]|nr:class B sortase [Oscillospiraceae bacterium]